jgi:hypothetical protein
LYNIVIKKSDTVANVLVTILLNVSFRGSLQGNNLAIWNDLVFRVMYVQLNDQDDMFKWNLHQNGQYSVHSLYLGLINNGVIQINTKVWKMKIALKIKVFMWYIQKGVVLTKDNLAKRNWNESKQYSFCMNNESIHHLFFKCYYARFLGISSDYFWDTTSKK